MSWELVTANWRTKLLALGLAVMMLGAVAFSQNPPTTGTRSVGLSYAVAPGLILIDPPTRINVTYSGLADAINHVSSSTLSAFVDATKAKPGQAVNLDVQAKDTDSTVKVQNPPPITVQIDRLEAKDVKVQVFAHAAPGWAITSSKAVCSDAAQPDPCTVHFIGPASWETNLAASVVLPLAVNVGTIDSPSQPIQVQNNSGPIDFSVRTVPGLSVDAKVADVKVEAAPGFTSTSVALVDSPPSAPPATGYRVTGVTITPNTVVVTGNQTVLAKLQFIQLPAYDLSGRTSDATFQVTVPYPSGVSGAVQTVKLVYSISQNPNTG